MSPHLPYSPGLGLSTAPRQAFPVHPGAGSAGQSQHTLRALSNAIRAVLGEIRVEARGLSAKEGKPGTLLCAQEAEEESDLSRKPTHWVRDAAGGGSNHLSQMRPLDNERAELPDLLICQKCNNIQIFM